MTSYNNKQPLANPIEYNATTIKDLGGIRRAEADALFEDNVINSQTDEARRAFHEFHVHAEKAIVILGEELERQNQRRAPLLAQLKNEPEKREAIQAELDTLLEDTPQNHARLGQIAILHDLMYHIDEGTANNLILKKAFEPAPAVMKDEKVANEGELQLKANQSSITPIACALFNKIKDINPPTGIKTPLKLPPSPGVGHNEFYSAIIAETLLREQGVPEKEVFTIVAAIINTVPFTSKKYQEEIYPQAMLKVCQANPELKENAEALVKETTKIDNMFTNNFDIANYRDPNALIKYTKLMQAEMDPQNHDKALGNPEDLNYIISTSLNNAFHEKFLPGMVKGGAQIFRGPDADRLNAEAMENVKTEVAFKKLRAVGAAIKLAEENGISADDFIKSLGISESTPEATIKGKEGLEANLRSWEAPVMGTDCKQGYSTDTKAADLIKEAGIDKAIQIAEQYAKFTSLKQNLSASIEADKKNPEKSNETTKAIYDSLNESKSSLPFRKFILSDNSIEKDVKDEMMRKLDDVTILKGLEEEKNRNKTHTQAVEAQHSKVETKMPDNKDKAHTEALKEKREQIQKGGQA